MAKERMPPSQPDVNARPVIAQCSSTYCWEAVLARPTLKVEIDAAVREGTGAFSI